MIKLALHVAQVAALDARDRLAIITQHVLRIHLTIFVWTTYHILIVIIVLIKTRCCQIVGIYARLCLRLLQRAIHVVSLDLLL